MLMGVSACHARLHSSNGVLVRFEKDVFVQAQEAPAATASTTLILSCKR
jgi:hypothetical protein